MEVEVGAAAAGGGFSHESEHDLALMVSDFLENGNGSGGAAAADSRYSSDSESGLSDLAHLADKISHYNCTRDPYESDLLVVVHSLVRSIEESDLHSVHSGLCNASCIRFCLVKLLRNSGHDAAVCVSKWQNCGKVPGGDHEYIDVVTHCDGGITDRFIIDIDFRSHFEIARAVESYDTVLGSLPMVFVGYQSKLKQFLQVMVEAARSSLKQNSMPVPPWRSLAYLQAKWQSPYQRKFIPDEHTINETASCDHEQCIGHLRGLKLSLQSEIATDRLLKPLKNDNNRFLMVEKRRHTSFRGL